MNCIATHHRHPIRIGDSYTMVPTKLLSNKTTNTLLPDLTLSNTGNDHSAPLTSAEKLSISLAALKLLVREAQGQTSTSMPKLDHMSWDGNRVPSRMKNPLTHHDVFTVHTRGAPKADSQAPTRRRQRPSKIDTDCPRRKELKLDNMGSIRRRMEEFHRQRKSGKCYCDFESDDDSDDEDLNV